MSDLDRRVSVLETKMDGVIRLQENTSATFEKMADKLDELTINQVKQLDYMKDLIGGRELACERMHSGVITWKQALTMITIICTVTGTAIGLLKAVGVL